jgi:hypothetical protein
MKSNYMQSYLSAWQLACLIPAVCSQIGISDTKSRLAQWPGTQQLDATSWAQN